MDNKRKLTLDQIGQLIDESIEARETKFKIIGGGLQALGETIAREGPNASRWRIQAWLKTISWICGELG